MAGDSSQPSRLAGLWSKLLWTLLALVAADAYIPFAPLMPTTGLDPSWMWGMNEAVARRLHFGTDIVFTFGPYASVFTRLYHPETVLRMFAATSYLAVVFIACFATLTRASSHRVAVILSMVFALLVCGNDTLLLVLPLLLALVIRRWTLTPESMRSRWWPYKAGLLLGCFGLLPLVKGTLLLLCGAFTGLCAAYVVQRRQWRLAVACLLVPPAALCVFWLIAGEPLSQLPHYFSGMRWIVAGYTEGMAVTGPARELIFFALPAGLSLAALATRSPLDRPDRFFLLALFGLFLLLSFKAGFVRHDIHFAIGLGCLTMAVILLLATPGAVGPLRGKLTVCLALTTAVAFAYQAERAVTRPPSVYGAMSNPLKLRLWAYDTRSWSEQYSAALRSISDHCQLDFDSAGSVDIYSYEQACLFTQRRHWHPRPILQSYSAYTPELARLNEAHLRGPSAPMHVVYKLQTIDDRWPLLDDGISLTALMDHYQVVAQRGAWLLLERNQQAKPRSTLETLGTVQTHLGEDVAVPLAPPVVAKIVIRPSLAGRLLAILYKPPPLRLRVTLANGETASYRVISGMMSEGFILSPHIDNMADFTRLMASDTTHQDGQAVKSIRLESPSQLPFWQETYDITFMQYQR